MRIGEAKRIFSEINFFKRTLKKYSNLLKNGRYIMMPSMRAMIIKDEKYFDTANKYFYKKIPNSLRKRLITKLNDTGFFNNKKDLPTQKYEAFYVANNFDKKREIKLFSFLDKKILTICVNHDDCQNQIFLYEKLHASYNMPKIEQGKQVGDSFEISMVDLKERPGERYALKNVLLSTALYVKENHIEPERKPVRELISFGYEDSEINSVLEKLCARLSTDILDTSIPLCLQHGDLSRDNLIYGDMDGREDFWWIDWEHMGSRFFLYDYYFYILNTALYFHDTSALEGYLNGEYNTELKECFDFFKVEFCKEKLKDYFLLFLVIFLKERVCDLGNITALNMYYDFICDFNLLSEG